MSPFEILAITFTNKAAGEMKERVAELVGPVAQRMWVSTFHSACVAHPAARGVAARLPVELHDLRPGRRRRASPTRCAATSTSTRSASRPGSCTRRSAALKNELVLAGEYAADRPSRPPERRIAEVYTEYQRRLHEASARRLRRPARARRCGCSASTPTRSTRYQQPLPARARRRVPGHERRAVGARPPARRGAPQRHGRRRRRDQIDLQVPRAPTSGTCCEFEETFPDATIDRARPELPVDPAHPRRRQRGDRQQRGAPAEAPLDRAGRRRADRPLPRRGRARRGRVRRARDRPARRRRATTASATSPSSTAPTRRAACIEETLVRAGRAVPRRRRREVLRPPRGQGRARVPPRAREPRRRGGVEAHRQHAQARRRRHVGRARSTRTRRARASRSATRCATRGRGGRDAARRSAASATCSS